METVDKNDRSDKKITRTNLRKLAKFANKGLQGMFSPGTATARRYKGQKPLLTCLCQGAAEHYVRPGYGVKDFDVWIFFTEHPKGPLYPRYTRYREIKQDFGPSKFGRRRKDCERFQGRRIDILGRSIPCSPLPKQNRVRHAKNRVRQWIEEGKTCTAKLLAQRPIIIISEAGDECGMFVWDPIWRD